MFLKITRKSGETIYRDTNGISSFMLFEGLKTGEYAKVEVVDVLEGVPDSVNILNPTGNSFYVSRLAFLKMVKLAHDDGGKIPTIKWVRTILGNGLVEAKNIVEFCAELGNK